MKKSISILALATLVLCSCGGGWTRSERVLIMEAGAPAQEQGSVAQPQGAAALASQQGQEQGSAAQPQGAAAPAPQQGQEQGSAAQPQGAAGGLMRVLKVTEEEDSLLLRTPSTELSRRMLRSEEWKTLSSRMLLTVQDENDPGVGIAAPQVGILRRAVAVQRFDMPGEPFFVYPNIRITGTCGPLVPGPEGCLSVPDRRGDVPRFHEITISYTSPSTFKDTVEVVTGFTAVIFQHECDHLDGVLYTDRLTPAP